MQFIYVMPKYMVTYTPYDESKNIAKYIEG